MATTELKSGSNTEAMALDQTIINGQTKEIAEMKTIFGTG